MVLEYPINASFDIFHRLIRQPDLIGSVAVDRSLFALINQRKALLDILVLLKVFEVLLFIVFKAKVGVGKSDFCSRSRMRPSTSLLHMGAPQ